MTIRRYPSARREGGGRKGRLGWKRAGETRHIGMSRASARQTTRAECERMRGRGEERPGRSLLAPVGVYLGRDMKNASNGPRGTSPFKSTAILLPTCHHFSDQKLPARVTFPVRRLPSAPARTTTLAPYSLPLSLTHHVVEKHPLPALTKHAKLYYTPGASPAYVFTPMRR